MNIRSLATIALLPPMLQQLFGYDVIDTGIVLMPRGVGVLISMQIAGQLMRRGVDARWLVAIGFTIGAWALHAMAQWSLEADRWHFMYTGLVQGLGLSAQISRPTGGASGSPTPTLCERIRLSCSVARSAAPMRVEASLPKPVLTP